VGHFGPIIEAERDETLSQYLLERGQKTQIFSFRLEASEIMPSRHPKVYSPVPRDKPHIQDNAIHQLKVVL
jgi:hypothetical protein